MWHGAIFWFQNVPRFEKVDWKSLTFYKSFVQNVRRLKTLCQNSKCGDSFDAKCAAFTKNWSRIWLLVKFLFQDLSCVEKSDSNAHALQFFFKKWNVVRSCTISAAFNKSWSKIWRIVNFLFQEFTAFRKSWFKIGRAVRFFFQNLKLCKFFDAKSAALNKNWSTIWHAVKLWVQNIPRFGKVGSQSDTLWIFLFKMRRDLKKLNENLWSYDIVCSKAF